MSFYLENKPDFDQAVQRVQAWFDRQVIDRAPVRFHRHNAEYESAMNSGHATLRERWMDAEFQANAFLKGAKSQRYNAETFPVYMPNLGPNWYSAIHGMELSFADVTSWAEPIIEGPQDLEKIKFSKDNVYYKCMHDLTRAAIDVCKGYYIVGTTDINPGMDCVAAWRGSENLCMDMLTDKEFVHRMMELSREHFHEVYNDFDAVLKAGGQPSSTWMNTPIPGGRLHIPLNDFSFMISPEQFEEFALPMLKHEVQGMTHNIFHMDGLGVANHADHILSVVKAIQWVQGVGDDYPIMQHVPFIKSLLAKGASVIVDLVMEDLDAFTKEVGPEGIFLWIATENEEQEHDIMNRLLRWK